MSSTARRTGATLINFRTLTNPHGLRFVEGGEGDGDAGQDTSAEQTGQQQSTEQPPAAKPAPPAKQPDQQAQAPADGKVEDLPDWAQKMIRDARGEAAKDRTNAKQAAADEARQQITQELGKALGLIKDDQSKVDPAELTQQVAQAQAQQREAAQELAVYKAASTLNGNPTKLLDSRSFLASIKDIDPTDDTKIAAAIQSAVTNDPSLKAQAATGASSANHTGGSGEGTAKKPTSLEEAVGGHYGT